MSLHPLPFESLVRRMGDEVKANQALFDLPVRKWYTPNPLYDLSASHFGQKAANPLGPAAGPHTQLAPNIVLSWLGGCRIMELKTVQVNDELTIPRPCIHAPNVGLNVEWSQELKVEESTIEYAKAIYLLEILKANRAFGSFETDYGLETLFDISVGYDLAGLQSAKVRTFLEAMVRPEKVFAQLRENLKGDLAGYRDLELPAKISDCVTLSTFHGCPPEEIEAMATFLIQDLGFHTIVKMNPTLLGFEKVQEVLHEQLGYTEYHLDRESFEKDLQYPECLAMMRRLQALGEHHGVGVGAKFTNTLVVANDASIFPTHQDSHMYLSGPPLHGVAMTLMQRFREDLALPLPISFSAGIHAGNFCDAVACGLTPITTCTDILRHGGYGRLPKYLKNLEKAMEKLGVSRREDYIMACRGHGEPNGNDPPSKEDLHRVELRNGADIVDALPENRYYHRSSQKDLKETDLSLDLYDCINCDLCIPACPNDAVFAYDVMPESSGVKKIHQLAILRDACNECSNCEIYCPEVGAPFSLKESVFANSLAFVGAGRDGFFKEKGSLQCRLDGVEFKVVVHPGNEKASVEAGADRWLLDWQSLELLESAGEDSAPLSESQLRRLRTVWQSLYRGDRVNAVHDTVTSPGEEVVS